MTEEDRLVDDQRLPSVEELDPRALHEQGGVLSVEAAAVLVQVSVPTVRAWIRRRQVFAFEWDGMTWVGQRSVYDCEAARRQAAAGRPRTLAPGARRSGDGA